MRKCLFGVLPIFLVAAAAASSARAGQIAVGYLIVDFPDSAGDTNSYEFDVINQTGANDSAGGCCTGAGIGDTFPIATQLLTNVSNLSVTAADGSTTLKSLGSGYFGLSSDAQSLTGGALFYNTPQTASNTPGSATLSGDFSTTAIQLDDGSTVNILPGFSVTLADPMSADLSDGDAAIIFATTAGGATTPEPGTWLLLSAGLVLLGFVRGDAC